MNVQSHHAPAAFAAAMILCPWLPASAAAEDGSPIAMDLPPDGARSWPRACSLRHALCLRAAPGTPPGVQLEVLAAADRAWDTLTSVLRAPAPEGPLGDPWEVFLVDGVDGGARVMPDERDPRSRFDRESSFAMIDPSTPPGCRLDFVLARAVAEGSLWRAVPATDIASFRAQSEALARLATPCAPPTEDDAAFQAEPWRCLVDPTSAAFDRGASVFVEWVDANFGSEPGAVLVGAWALAPTRTAPGAWRWPAVPTTFDVLRASLPHAFGRETTFDDLLAKFAVARASMDPRPALAWRLPWPTVARRVTPAEPIAPTGVSYVNVDHKNAPPGARLRLEAHWEDYARMRWVVLKRDALGRTLAELPVTSTDLGTAASLNVEGLDGVDHILIVTQNLGSTEHAFNPDQGEWEPHGWVLTVEAQGPFGP